MYDKLISVEFRAEGDEVENDLRGLSGEGNFPNRFAGWMIGGLA